MAPSASVDGQEIRPAESGSLGEPDRVPNGQRKKKKYRFYKRFTYQQLRGWKPILSANEALLFFSIAGTILLGLGIPILVASLNVVEYQIRYDDAGQLAPLSNEDRAQQVTQGDGVTYQMRFTVDKEMKSPIYVGFVLDEFYQNFRRYVRSFDPKQMRNGDIFPGVSACNPFLYEGFDENSSLPESGAILPCGQISHSNFNDSFLLGSVNGDIPIDSSNIAWQSDADNLYGDVDSVNFNIQPQYRGGNTTSAPLNQDQHWMVWQRPAGRRNLNKLYGKIDQDIPEGTEIRLQVFNRYNTYDFGGAKYFLITTNSWVAGRNLTLPILYLIVSFLCYCFAIFFFLSYHAGMLVKRRIGDLDALSWMKPTAG